MLKIGHLLIVVQIFYEADIQCQILSDILCCHNRILKSAFHLYYSALKESYVKIVLIYKPVFTKVYENSCACLIVYISNYKHLNSDISNQKTYRIKMPIRNQSAIRGNVTVFAP